MTRGYFRRQSALGAICLLLAIASHGVAQSTLIPVTMGRDLAFDHASKYLYISTGDGFVRRYNIAAAQFDAAYNIGGCLLGMDIASDDSFLLVAQAQSTRTQGTIHRLNLSNGSVTNITYMPGGSENGAWDVAIASNNSAFFTTQDAGYYGSRQVPLRQINLATNEVTTRPDASGSGSNGMVTGYTQITRNASGTRLYLLESYYAEVSFTYDAITDTFGPRAYRDTVLPSDAPGAVDRTGSMIATTRGGIVSVDTAPELKYLRTVGAYISSSVVFHPTEDRLYVVEPGTYPNAQIVAYDTKRFREQHRLEVEEYAGSYDQFGAGTFIASPDGRYLALATRSGIRLFNLPQGPFAAPPAPVFSSADDLVFDHAGRYVYVASGAYVWPYNLSSRSFEAPYDGKGGGAPIDIAPDDSHLLLGGGYGLTEGRFVNLDLATGAATKFDYPRVRFEGGPGSVAIGANGIALAITYGTSQDASSPRLRDVNLATGVVTLRSDAPTYSGEGKIWAGDVRRTPDATRMYLIEGNRQFTYSAATNSFGSFSTTTLKYLFAPLDIAISRDGGLIATSGTDFSDRRFALRTQIQSTSGFGVVGELKVPSSGIVFDAATDTLYVLNFYLSQIVAYDTKTFQERFRFDTGTRVYPYTREMLVASHDGRYLALRGTQGLHVFSVPGVVQLVSTDWAKTAGPSETERNLPLDGPPFVESRRGGSNSSYAMIFTFGQNLTSVGGAAVTAGTATVSSAMIDPNNPRRYVVNLSGVVTEQHVKVTLNNVVDAQGNKTERISQVVGVLIGDANGDGKVNSGDLLKTQNSSGQELNGENFRSDVNNDGLIGAADLMIVRSASGGQLPPTYSY